MTIQVEQIHSEFYQMEKMKELAGVVNSLSQESNISCIKELPVTGKVDTKYSVTSYVKNTNIGGGVFVWEPDLSKGLHNGGTILAPEALSVWDGSHASLGNILNWTGSGSGCYVRLFENVYCEYFGALPDEILTGADSSLSFNMAMLHSSLLHSECLVNKGSYNVEGLKLPSNLKMRGAGKYVTTLRLKTGSVKNMFELRETTSSVKFNVSSLTMEGNKGAANGSGFYVICEVNTSGTDGFFSTVRDVLIKQFNKYGVYVEAPSGLEAAVGFEMENVTVQACTLENIYLKRVTDGFFKRITSAGSDKNGIYLDQCANNKFTACKTYYNDLGGWSCTGGKRNTYAECEAQEDFKGGVYFYEEIFSQIDFLCDANGRIGDLGYGMRLMNCQEVRGNIDSTSFHNPTWQNRGILLENNTSCFFSLKNNDIVSTPITVVGTGNDNVFIDNGISTEALYSGSSSLVKVSSLANKSGTFTPALTFASGSPTINYSIQRGYFNKQGDTVMVQVTVTATVTKGTASGAISITGLPFPKVAGTPTAVGGALTSGLGTGVTSLIGIVGAVEGTGSSIIIRANKTGLGWQSLTADNLTDGTVDFSCTLWYRC